MMPEEIKFNKYDLWRDYHWNYYYNRNNKSVQDGGGRTYNDHMDRMVALVKEKNVLDIGCGDGLLASLLKCKGIDTEPEGIKWAKKHKQDCELGTIYELEKWGKFDAVVVSDIMTGLSEPETAIEEMKKVTSKIYVASHKEERRTKRTFWGIEEMNALFAKYGFKPTFTDETAVRIYVIYEL